VAEPAAGPGAGYTQPTAPSKREYDNAYFIDGIDTCRYGS
jgi:hypothetical protein